MWGCYDSRGKWSLQEIELDLGSDSCLDSSHQIILPLEGTCESLPAICFVLKKPALLSLPLWKQFFESRIEVIGKRWFEMQMFTLNTTFHKHLSATQGNHLNVYHECLQTKIECQRFDKIHVHSVRNLFISHKVNVPMVILFNNQLGRLNLLCFVFLGNKV